MNAAQFQSVSVIQFKLSLQGFKNIPRITQSSLQVKITNVKSEES